MNGIHRKGFALLLLGIIASFGAVLQSTILMCFGLGLGVIGTIMVFWEPNTK